METVERYSSRARGRERRCVTNRHPAPRETCSGFFGDVIGVKLRPTLSLSGEQAGEVGLEFAKVASQSRQSGLLVVRELQQPHLAGRPRLFPGQRNPKPHQHLRLFECHSELTSFFSPFGPDAPRVEAVGVGDGHGERYGGAADDGAGRAGDAGPRPPATGRCYFNGARSQRSTFPASSPAANVFPSADTATPSADTLPSAVKTAAASGFSRPRNAATKLCLLMS